MCSLLSQNIKSICPCLSFLKYILPKILLAGFTTKGNLKHLTLKDRTVILSVFYEFNESSNQIQLVKFRNHGPYTQMTNRQADNKHKHDKHVDRNEKYKQ